MYTGFIDSGSNGVFFLNGATAGIAECSSGSGLQGFYCPSGPLNLSAQNKGSGGNPIGQVNFSVANAAFTTQVRTGDWPAWAIAAGALGGLAACGALWFRTRWPVALTVSVRLPRSTSASEKAISPREAGDGLIQ